MCELLLGLILMVLVVQSERVRRALRPRVRPSPAASPVGPAPVEPPPAGPGLSAHCGHTHHSLVTDRHGLTACPACAGRG